MIKPYQRRAKHGYPFRHSRWEPRRPTGGQERKMRLLHIAAGVFVEDFHGPRGQWGAEPVIPRSIPIHCEGGMALKNPDLQYLLDKGYLKTVRGRHRRPMCFSSGYSLATTLATITDEGRAAVMKGKL